MQTVPPLPDSPRDDVSEMLHGTRIIDPFRWLEDGTRPETVAWVEAQNAHSRGILDGLPGREDLRRRLESLLSLGTVGAPRLYGNRSFYTRRSGGQNQPVLLARDRGGEDRVLVDPNAMSGEGLLALDWWYPSWDGALLAYGISQDGDEWSTLHVLDAASGEDLGEAIGRTRFSSIAWLPDSSGFYYTRYPAPGQVPPGDENYHKKIFFHRLGDDPASDALVFGAGLAAEAMPSISISRDGRYLLAFISLGWERTDVYLCDLQTEGADFLPLAVGYDAHFDVREAGGVLFIHTDLEAQRYRVFRVDPGRPERDAWEEIIPEQQDAVLQTIVPAGQHLVALYLRNAVAEVVVYDPHGRKVRDVALPAPGTVTDMSGSGTEREAYFLYESFTIPPRVYALDVEDGGTTVWAEVEGEGDAESYAVEQVWYPSRDGTQISMFLVQRRDLEPDRLHPTLLTGYGGFNLSRTPLFAPSNFVWLERGGVYALPNLRGGGEYGEAWHRAGMLDRKQNVFDDFIAAAEYLIREGRTDPGHLAIAGRSNGGLLVGAALTQRPDLFQAVVCGVPLLDMLRYHHFQIARLWIPEYGSAENPEQFPFIHAYSPYHHVVRGERYPAVLLVTAEADTRVDPLHARKMAALLQQASGSGNPVLLTVESRAGHGMGKPIAKQIDDQVDFWSFLLWQLGMHD